MFVLEATIGALSYLLLALLVGSLITASFLLPSSDAVAIRRRLVFVALVLASVFLVVHLLSLLVQGMKLSGGAPPSAEVLARYAFRTQSGKIWLWRAAYTIFFLLLTVIFLRRGHQPLILFLLSLPLLASRSLSGHAVAVRDNRALLVVVDAAHLVATALWAGGLPFMLYLLLQERPASSSGRTWTVEGLKRFSRLAIFSVTVLLLTGLYQTLTHVGGLEALKATPYGNLLMVKLILFGFMLTLGLANFVSTRPIYSPRRARLPPKLKKPVFNRIGAEALLGMMILILSGFLTVLPPAAHRDHAKAGDSPAAQATAGPHGEHHPIDHELKPTARPIKLAEGASVKIITPKPGQVFTDDRVPIEFRLEKGRRGHHVHAYVDNELVGMFESEQGTLTGISRGNHVLTLRVTEADHKTELDASDQVDFSVK